MASEDSPLSTRSDNRDYSSYDEDFDDGTTVRSPSRSDVQTPERSIYSPRKQIRGKQKTSKPSKGKTSDKKVNKKLQSYYRQYAGSATNNTTHKSKIYNNNVTNQLLSANRTVIADLEDKVADMRRQIKQLKEENKLQKTVQHRQARALCKYEDTEAELPSLIQRHMNEVNNLRERLRRTQESITLAQHQIKEKDDKIWKLEDRNKKLTVLVEDNQLAERDKLATEVEDLKQKLIDRDKKVTEVEKARELEVNFKTRDMKEQAKRFRHVQQTLETALEENRKLQLALKEKERELDLFNMYSVRHSKGNSKFLTDQSAKDAVDDILNSNMKYVSHSIHKEREEVEKRLSKEKERKMEEERIRQEEAKRKAEEERRANEEERRKQEDDHKRLLAEQAKRDAEERKRKWEEAKRVEEEKRRLQKEEEKREGEAEEKKKKEEEERRQREKEERRKKEEEERKHEEEERLAAERANEERRKKDLLLARLRASDQYKNDGTSRLSPSPPDNLDEDSGRGTSNENGKNSYKSSYKTENLHQGRPALSKDGDYYGTKVDKQDKTKKQPTIDNDIDKQAQDLDKNLSQVNRQKPSFGRRAKGDQTSNANSLFGGDDALDLQEKPKRPLAVKDDDLLLEDDDSDGLFEVPKKNDATKNKRNRNQDLFDSPKASRNNSLKGKSSIFGDENLFDAKPAKSNVNTNKSNITLLGSDDDDIFNTPKPTQKFYPWGKNEISDKPDSGLSRDRTPEVNKNESLGRPQATKSNILDTRNKISDFSFDDDIEEINL